MSISDREAAEQEKKLDDQACGRLMEIYVQEAEQYDRGLVQSWKDDMDVTLVFSGLYSAVLTAFVIESYQKLQEDPADASVSLLHSIADQLALLSNSSAIVADSPRDKFTPTPAAVACNILWFSSLLLAISCAFLATFVQQWSRQFMHRTGQLRSSTAHARLFSFLYFGLKNFQMHTVVNVIPSMLHLSLFLFLGGLIAFLRDVNPVLTYIVVGALAIVTLIYFALTIWPLLAPSSPFQTPLSPVAWQIWDAFALEKFKHFFAHNHEPNTPEWNTDPNLPSYQHPQQPPSFWKKISTFTSPVSDKVLGFAKQIAISFTTFYQVLKNLIASGNSEPAVATVDTPAEKKHHSLSSYVLAAAQKSDTERDAQAISWTLSSITEDPQLLQFVEALPDAIYGPNGICNNNIHLIKALVETTDPQCDIIHRITSLMINASNSWFDEKHRTRCSIACPKALWALAFMFEERRDQFDPGVKARDVWFPEQLLSALVPNKRSATDDRPGRKYAISAAVLCAVDTQLTPAHAGSAVRRFLQASREPEPPFEFERTSFVLRKYLSGDIPSDGSFMSNLFYSYPFSADKSIVPQINEENPLTPDQMVRLDVLACLCLHLPELPFGNADLLLEFIEKRVETDGWGSSWRIWDNCKSLGPFDECSISRRFCNVMREYVHTLQTSFGTQIIEPLLLACVCLLQERSNNDDDANIDTSRIALETMIAMKVIVVSAPEPEEEEEPEEQAEVSEDFKFVRQYVEENVLRLGDVSWTRNDAFYSADVKAGIVVILVTRLLKRFLMSADDPVATNDTLDAMEFLVFNSYRPDLFKRSFRAVDEELLVSFSRATLDTCRWWTETPSDDLSRNGPDIIAWMWQVWGYLKLPQSGEANRNLAEAAELMLFPESLGRVEESRSVESSRVPAPHKRITTFLDGWRFDDRFDFEHVLGRYRNLQNDDQSIQSQGLNAASPALNDLEDSAMADVERFSDIRQNMANDSGGCSNPGSPITQAPVFSPLPNDHWVI